MKPKNNTLQYLGFIALAGFSPFGSQSAQATDRTWSGATDTTWSTGANWGGTVPISGDNGVFTGTFSNQPNLTASATVGGLWMTGTLGQNVTIALSGGTALTINGNTINGTAGLGILVDNTDARTLTISAPITVGGAQTWKNASGNLFSVGAINTNAQALTLSNTSTGGTTVSGVISGSGAVTINNTGAGVTTFSNTGSTYSGQLTVQSGTLAIGTANNTSANGALGNSSGSVILGGTGAQTGTLEYTGATASSSKKFTMATGGTGVFQIDTAASTLTLSGLIDGSGALSKTGAGALTLSNGNTYSGGTTISAGTVTITNAAGFGTNTVAIGGSGTAVINNGTGATTVANAFSGAGILNTTLPTGANTLTLSGVLSGFTGTLNVGSGSAGGKLAFSNVTQGNVISSSATINVAANGTLYVFNPLNYGSSLVLNGGTTGEALGQLRIEGGATWSGNITLNANTTIGSNGGTGTISGAISGSGFGFTKLGGGTNTLTNTNTYSGGTTINAGTLQFGKLVSMPASGAVTANTGSTLAVNLGGTGEWTTGTSGNGTVGGLLAGSGGQSGGTVTWSGAVNLGLDTTNAGSTQTYSNIANVGTTLGINKLGTGTLELSGTNTYTGQTTVSGGTLNYSGTLSSAAQINVGVAGGGNAVMNVLSGANINMNNTHVLIGAGTSVSSGPGFVYQSGGTLQGGSQAPGGTGYTGLRLGGAGQGAYGYYNMSGGSLNVSELDIAAGDTSFNGAGFGVMDISGGTVSVGQGSPTNNGWLIVNRDLGSGGIGILNLTGGTMTFTGPAAQFQNNWGTNGTAIINISNATLTAANADINLNQKNNGGNFGEINLLTGGTLQAHSIASNASGTKLVNFNGGTLKASTASAAFITTNNSAVTVFANGGTIDNNGVAIGIPVGLLAATGNGVSNVAITSGGSGYLGAPAVTFSGGGGTGAAGYATVSGGVITGIVITNPGTGYTSAPAITLTGGGSTNATIGTITTAANTAGGMTFAGTGTTTLTGANTYNGTTVNAGTVTVGTNGTLGATTGALAVNNANTGAGTNVVLNLATAVDTTVGSLSGTKATPSSGTNTATINTQTARNFIVNQTAAGTYAGVIAGAGTFTLGSLSTNTLTLSGANTYSGKTTVSAGTLQFAKETSLYNNTNASWTAANINVASGATLALNVGGTGEFTSSDLNTLLTNISVANSSTSGLQSGAKLGFDTTNASGGTFTQGNLIADSTGVNGGAIGVTKLGTGTLVLDKANTYSGATTISAGILLVSGSIGNSAVTVANNATLASGTTGTIGSSVSVSSGGKLAAGGVGAIGTATVGSGGLAFSSGSIFEWDIDSSLSQADTNAGTGYDSVKTASFSGPDASVFKVVLASGDTFGSTFWDSAHNWTNIFSTDGTTANALNIASIFSSFAGSGVASDGTVTGQGGFTFNGSTTLTWSAVPEPTSALAGLLLTAGLLRRRRKN